MGKETARIGVLTLASLAFLFGGVAIAEEQPGGVRHPLGGGEPHTTASSVVVVDGDHLWKISEHHLDDREGRDVEDSMISPYWRTVIAVNLESLRSGDPDLIYPGEVVTLP